eukprot:COSAG01_NODE_25339_length_748_cov_1.012327_1_plen_37_part_10
MYWAHPIRYSVTWNPNRPRVDRVFAVVAAARRRVGNR